MKSLDRRRIYVFIKQKNPYLNIIAVLCLLGIIVLISVVTASAFLKEKEEFQAERNEIDPRKTLRIDYAT